MAFFRFGNEARIAMNPEFSARERRWAIWRCCCVIANVCEISVFELYEALAKKIGFVGKREPAEDEMPSNEQLLLAIGVLVQLRFRQLEHLKKYESTRKKQKLKMHRFPVSKLKQREFLLNQLKSIGNA